MAAARSSGVESLNLLVQPEIEEGSDEEAPDEGAGKKKAAPGPKAVPGKTPSP